jgi:FkbM family methyltransferase
MALLHSLIVRCAHVFNIHLSRWRPEQTEFFRIQHLIQEQRISHVVDVGANIGQFALHLMHSGYQGRITSFEPQNSAYAQLVAAAKSHPNWVVPERCALGAATSELLLNVSSNSVSSSLMLMEHLHLESEPNSMTVAQEPVPVRRLDDVLQPHQDGERLLLKVDTQGFELQVLAGAEETLKRCAAIQIETSFVPLYAGQPLFAEMVGHLTKLGFTVIDALPGFQSPTTGRLLQVDLLAVRT